MGASFTIQISGNLLKQLGGDGEKPKRKTKILKTRILQELQQSKAKVRQKLISHDFGTLKGTPSMGWPGQSPLLLPVSSPLPQSAKAELDRFHSAIQEGVKALDRLQKQEEIIVQEVNQRAKDLHDREFIPYQNRPPCLVEKDACFDCYKERAKDPLKCSNVVQNYADCIRRDQQQAS